MSIYQVSDEEAKASSSSFEVQNLKGALIYSRLFQGDELNV
jgi:hypothetical protein